MFVDRLVVGAVAAACVFGGLPAGAVAQSPAFAELERLDALAVEAATASDVLGAAALAEMATPLLDWDAPEARVARLDAIAADAADPEVRAQAQNMALQAARAAGSDVVAREAALGVLSDWALLGPFPNDGMSALSTPLQPEREGRTDRPVDGRFGELVWRDVTAATQAGYVDLSAWCEPVHNGAVFAATTVSVRRSTDATLWFGVDGAYRLWVDGEPVAGRDIDTGGDMFSERVDVRLRGGETTIVFKLAAGAGALGLRARLTDDAGAPIGFDAQPAAAFGALPSPDAWPEAESLAARIAALEPRGALESAAAAIVLRQAHRADPAEPWRVYVDAGLGDDADTHALRRVAASVTDAWRRVPILARAAEDGGALDRAAWAVERRQELGLRASEEALFEATAMRQAGLRSLNARLIEAHAAVDFALLGTALQRYEALLADAPGVSRVALAAADTAGVLRWTDRELAALRAAVGADAVNPAPYARLVQMLASIGEHEQAGRYLERMLAVAGPDVTARLAAAQAYRAMGDHGVAVELASSAASQCPGCFDAHTTLLELARLVDESERAVAHALDALAVRPQAAEVRAFVDTQMSEVDDAFAEYRFSLDELVAMQTTPSSADYDVLVDQQVADVHANGLATTWTQFAAVANTQAGADGLRAFAVGYTPDAELVDVESVRVRKPDGRVLDVYDLYDDAPYTGPSAVYYDVHTLHVLLAEVSPGDLVTYSYRVSDVAYANIFDDYYGDVWFVQGASPRRLARFVVRLPNERPLYVSEPAFGAWTTSERDGRTEWVYEAHDVPAVAPASRTPGPAERYAYVSVSTYEEWDALADWYWNLITPQLITSDEIQATVDALIEGLSDPREIVAAVYGYVVRNTRYVGLEFGIHGYKPYRTTDCFSRRFGDCKDTASLMKVMLDAAGVPARIALVRTRRGGRVDGHPPSLAVFDHAIAYVPSLDLFLDGTAGFSGSRELPYQDQGASVLIVDDGQGGRFTEIPVLPASATQQRSVFTVDHTGAEARGDGMLHYSGAYASTMRTEYDSPQRRDERFNNALASIFPGVRIDEAELTGIDDIESDVSAAFAFEGGQWALDTGARVSVAVAAPWGSLSSFAPGEGRTVPLEIPFARSFEVELTHVIPETWRLTGPLPSEAQVTPFGSYALSCVLEAPALRCNASVAIDHIRVAPEALNEFRAFISAVDGAMTQRVSFEKQEGAQ